MTAKFRFKFYALILVSLLLIIFFSFTYLNNTENKLTSSQKSYTVKNVLGRNIRQNKPVSKSWKQYRGNYVVMQYPETAVIYSRDDEPQSENFNPLELFSFDLVDPRITFSLSVFLKDGVFDYEDISGAKYRRQNANLYRESKIIIDKMEAVYFEKDTQGAEKTIFLIGNKNIFTISATGPLPDNSADRLFEKIISTIRILE